MAERPKFQFRMRDLLWAVSLIGVSLGLGIETARIAQTPFASFGILSLWTSISCLGAGIVALFRQPLIGMVAGFAAFGILTLFCQL